MNWKNVVAATAVSAALVLPAPGAAALPEAGVLVPGKSLAGVRLGMTKKQVTAAWGARHGVCRECRRTTWYFNYEPFTPEGAGVVFRRGRAAHLFTMWEPTGWRTRDGLVLGAPGMRIREVYARAAKRSCIGYDAYVLTRGRAQSVFYEYDGRLWGFGLTRRGTSPCV